MALSRRGGARSLSSPLGGAKLRVQEPGELEVAKIFPDRGNASSQERRSLEVVELSAERGNVSSHGASATSRRATKTNVNPFCVRLKSADIKGSAHKAPVPAHVVPRVYWIGNPKTGTTSMINEFPHRFPSFRMFKWAASWFKNQYSQKERNYFSPLRDVHPKYAGAFVKEAPICPSSVLLSKSLFSADFTPSYLRFSEYAIPTMKDMYANYLEPSVDPGLLKFIVSFRDPVPRTESCWNHGWRNGMSGWLKLPGEKVNWKETYAEWAPRAIKSATDCVRKAGGLQARSLPKECGLNCMAQSLHVLLLRPWVAGFNPDQFFVTDLETMLDKGSTEQLYSELGNFLEVQAVTGRTKFSKNNDAEYKKAGEATNELMRTFFRPWEAELQKELCRWKSEGLTLVSVRSQCP